MMRKAAHMFNSYAQLSAQVWLCGSFHSIFCRVFDLYYKFRTRFFYGMAQEALRAGCAWICVFMEWLSPESATKAAQAKRGVRTRATESVKRQTLLSGHIRSGETGVMERYYGF